MTRYAEYMNAVREEGARALKFARENNRRIMILAGRPYHIDAEIGHGIDKLANTLGFVVVSEDSVFRLGRAFYRKGIKSVDIPRAALPRGALRRRA